MAQNYISRGEVISVTAGREYFSGHAYRINGFNGVALIGVDEGNLLSFQLEGVFEFSLPGVKMGDIIYIDNQQNLLVDLNSLSISQAVFPFGQAVTGSDHKGNFHCRLLQWHSQL